jgi:hypothetical protein
MLIEATSHAMTQEEMTEWCLMGCYALIALERADVSEELSASFIRVTRIGD